MSTHKFSRRDFLKVGGLSAAVLLGNRYLGFGNAMIAHAQMGEEFMPDAEIVDHRRREVGADPVRRADARLELHRRSC